MQTKLKIDLQQLQSTIKDYEQSIRNFEELSKVLVNSVDDLKSSGWDSDAGKKYFQQFDETWKVNMSKHILILSHLKECLIEAKNEYETIYNQIPTLKDTL